jgi:hypothetical protein
MRTQRAFRPSLGDAPLEDRVALSTAPALFSPAPPVATANVTVQVVHNRYYAPLISQGPAVVRAEAVKVAFGQETLAQAVANLNAYFNAQMAALNAGTQAVVWAQHPYRGANINAGVNAVNTQTAASIGAILNGAGITNALQLYAASSQVEFALRAGYQSARAAIYSGGYPYAWPWAFV